MWLSARLESPPVVCKDLADVPNQLIWRNLRREMRAPCNIAERFSRDTFRASQISSVEAASEVHRELEFQDTEDCHGQ